MQNSDLITCRFFVHIFGMFHLDIDECKENICGEKGNCTNTEGSYTCQCEEGYTIDEQGCIGMF